MGCGNAREHLLMMRPGAVSLFLLVIGVPRLPVRRCPPSDPRACSSLEKKRLPAPHQPCLKAFSRPSPPSFYPVAAARTIRHPTNALGLQVAQAEIEAASSACLQAYGNRGNLTLQAGP